ncbi:MAG: methylene-tetrahydromethanopterin dehydrogenase N-terminal domain-containing protein, partial [Singulisphaera sp.]
MSKSKILVQLDTDDQPSVFDAVVAVDAGVDHLLRHHAITPENVRERVHGAIFTRGPEDLHQTALFVGGSDVARGEQVLAAIVRSFIGPLR